MNYRDTNPETIRWICRMLGYQSFKSYTYYPNSWQYPLRYTNLQCSGDVVPRCRYQEFSRSYTSYRLLVNCSSRTQFGNIINFYLANKNGQHTQRQYGLLMYNGGKVSGSKFDSDTAELICYIMGYKGAMSWKIGRYSLASQRSFTITDLNCVSKNRAFPTCTYETNAENITHIEDIWLWCNDPNSNYDPVVCPPGQRKCSNKCYDCLTNTYSPDPNESSTCTCLPCPPNSTSLSGSTFCSCDSGFYLNHIGDQCLKCSERLASSLSSDTGVCDCLPGTFWSDKSGKCEPCPPNHFSGKSSSLCEMCPAFTVSVTQSAECTSCPNGKSWSNYTCTECPENQVGNGAKCSVCPEGTSPSKDRTICMKSGPTSSIDPVTLSIVSITVSTIFTVVTLVNLVFTWRERRARQNLQTTHQAGSSTGRGERELSPVSSNTGESVQHEDVVYNSDYANLCELATTSI